MSYFPRQPSGIQYTGPPALPQQMPAALAPYQAPIIAPAQDDTKGNMQWLIAKDLSDVKKTVIMVGGAIAALILIDMAIQSSRRRI